MVYGAPEAHPYKRDADAPTHFIFCERRIEIRLNFERFSKIVSKYYPGSEFTVEETLSVFRYYFDTYQATFGKPHPPIRLDQALGIIVKMPHIENGFGNPFSIDPDCYIPMIDKHFHTHYRKCDYNINHFFSGRIRTLRFFETCY